MTDTPTKTTWATTRTKNFPTWILATYPAAFDNINPDTIFINHLKDLYPYIWAYGPRGETYITQINHVHHLLGTAYDTLIESVNTNYDRMDLATTTDNNLLSNISQHALQTGHPIHCSTYDYGEYDSNYPIKLLEHPIWSTTNKQDQALFLDFLDNFSIISLHHDYLTDLPNMPELNHYHTFCDVWGIPR